MGRVEAARQKHSGPRAGPSRTHLQPRSWHSAADSGGEREKPGQVRAGVFGAASRCHRRNPIVMQKPAVLLLAHGTPDSIEEIPAYLANVTGGRPLPAAL